MDAKLILWPLLLQVLLTLTLFILLGKRKAVAFKEGKVDRQKAALDNSAWPDEVLKVSNSIQNQFQTPVLFYILSLALFVSGGVTTSVLVVAWLYAVSRLVHAYIHVGSNYVPARFRVFVLGCLSLIALLAMLLIHLTTI